MEEKKIFRVHDEVEKREPDPVAEDQVLQRFPEEHKETEKSASKEIKQNPQKKEKKKKGLMSQFSAFGKVAFILGLLLIIGSAGVIAATQIPSLLPNGSKSPTGNGSTNETPGNTGNTGENLVTEQDATVLQQTADAGDEYMDDLLFIGDSNYNRMYMLGLLDLDHVIGVDGMGVQSVPSSNVVYFVEKSNPITIPEAVKIMQPKTIVMNYGTNNLVAGTAESFIENYEEAIDAIQKAYPYADIIIQSIPPVGSDLPSGYRMVDYKKVYTFNNALIKMCEERGLHYLNVTEDVWRSSDGHCKSEYITSDGIHLEQTAYERLLTYVRTHALLTEDTRPELTEKLTRKAAPVVVYQYQCDVVVTSAMESFYDEGYVDYKKVKEGDKEENYKDPDTYKFTIPKADATKGSEEEMGQALFKSVNSQVKKKDKAQIAISYKISEDGDYVFTVTVKEVCTHEYETKDYVEATCTHAGSKTLVCKICGKKTVTTTEMLDHEYDWDTAHDYKDGKITVKCKLCEKEYEVAHGENDHDWNEGTVVKEPTCTDKGSKQSKCTICGIEKEIEIPALGHDYVVDTANSVAATCTEAGTNSYKCSRCGNTDKPSETVAALGHDFSKVYSETPATCTESGSRTYCCSRCGTLSPSDPEIIPAKGHSFSSGPTCDNCPEPNPNYQPPVEQPPEGEDEG